jgi:DNA end-binding protein Ku
MARPYWSGQIQISLVSFGVKLIPATEAKSEIHFHQLSRKSGDRIRHQKVSSSDEEPVQKDDIVMGYEYSKGEYVQIEPDELKQLRVESQHIIEVQQFVGIDEVSPAFFEKPYFVLPENEKQAAAFAVVKKALQQTGKVGLGKIALSGREHVIAIGAPADAKLAGMMAYTLRYAAELRNASEYFAEIKNVDVDDDQLSLAKELIKRRTAKFAPEKFTDDYEGAIHELVEAKLKHIPLKKQEKAPRGKVIDLMDALRKSVKEPTQKKPVNGVSAEQAANQRGGKHGLKIVGTGEKRRKSA